MACEEASHFQQLQERLEAIGSHYGALPVHDGLWESAAATAHSLPARLAVESCVHEARGLDRLPHTIQRFCNAGDHESAKLLETIYQVCAARCMLRMPICDCLLMYLQPLRTCHFSMAAAVSQFNCIDQKVASSSVCRSFFDILGAQAHHTCSVHYTGEDCHQDAWHMQEEIAHCAAGVRWLTYLHRQACSAAKQHALSAQLQNANLADNTLGNGVGKEVSTLNSNGSPHTQSDDMPGNCLSRDDSTQDSIGKPHAQFTRQLVQSGDSANPEPPSTSALPCKCEPERQSSGSNACDQNQSAAHGHAINGNTLQVKEAVNGSMTVPRWQADAQQYARVEEWFHSLVRANFKGSLKVGCLAGLQTCVGASLSEGFGLQLLLVNTLLYLHHTWLQSCV